MMTSSSYRNYLSPPPFNSPRPSPWHSPAPYLFAGLAAMLGLTAFALLILACSYWKLSCPLEDDQYSRDQESGNAMEIASVRNGRVFEEKFLVIMAGEVKATYLATRSSSTTSSFRSEKTAAAAEGSGLDGSRDQNETNPGR